MKKNAGGGREASLKGTTTGHSISGSVTKFEVFQAGADRRLP